MVNNASEEKDWMEDDEADKTTKELLSREL